MDIRNSVEGLKTLLGVPSTDRMQAQQVKSGSAANTDASPLVGDSATLSSAGTEVAQTAAESGVRMEKVAAVQAALAAGTYNVPAAAVAGKVVDAMLSGSQTSGN
ncbi:MAG: flagellar biosynthesis anti-sigma factor FlgM [Terracidiphilus sp.]